MSYEEKNAWAFGLVAVVSYAVYLVLVLRQAGTSPLVDVPYAPIMLGTIGAAIVVCMVAAIVIAVATPREARRTDERDREINRVGEYTGQSLVVIGATAALLMALAEWDYFWIANVIYLCFMISAVLTTGTKIVLYRKGMPSW